MVFSSLLFLFRFLPLVLIVYFLAPKKMRNFILFVFSLFFYAWGEPVYVFLILLSTLVDYTAGRIVGYLISKDKKSKAKWAVLGSAVINLSLLGFFKYADFVIQTLNTVMSLELEPLELALPIGISFYTFQTMSYTIDVYREEAPVQKNFITFGAFVSLFPQLIAGPIVRYQTIAEQLNHREESFDQFAKGVLRFTIGLGKKVLLANQIGALWNEISSMQTSNLTVATAWLGILAYSLQIYFDFSGYSDMAIGLGHMFGFTFLENFNYPYESKSITEFWRRWHISLGTWFKEYVYIPLGGNRKGKVRHMLNIAIVWLLTGLWHGASWNFVLWGVYYGVLLVIEKFLLKKLLDKLPKFISHIYAVFFVMIGWAIFSWLDMSNPTGYMKALFGFGKVALINDQFLYLLISNGLMLLIGMIGSTSIVKKKCTFMKEEGINFASVVYVGIVFIICVAFLINSSYNPFLYFRF